MKLLVFTYAPAGLGHLRVTEALVSSKPDSYKSILLGSNDRFITTVHRFFSTNFIGKWLFDNSQYGLLEDFFTFVYKQLLFLGGSKVFHLFKDIIRRHNGVSEIWIIASHFGLAHQIGLVKEKLVRETGVKVRLVVQVTDDTTQHIWCVKGADLTIVPSVNTKNGLEFYSRSKKIKAKFAVAPYPLGVTFSQKIKDPHKMREMAYLSTDNPINIAFPISGAAVGLKFVLSLIRYLSGKSDRFRFFVVSKKSKDTRLFLSTISKIKNVVLVLGNRDIDVVNNYEELYLTNTIHLEVTKPSEQAFKAILHPSLVGGSILLFADPVGRQEYENIDFVKKHGLLPEKNGLVPRAIRLPRDPKMAADVIAWGVESGLFKKMSLSNFNFSQKTIDSKEVGSDGSRLFWDILHKELA